MNTESRTCLSLLEYPIPNEGVIQTYLTSYDGYTQSNNSTAHWSGIKASGKTVSVVYVIYLGEADLPPALLTCTQRQQRESWTLWLIKPGLAEKAV